jgi:DNA-binding NarL/FixJ family response regulator
MRILLVDDHESVRAGVRMALRSHPEFEVCGEASNGREALEKASEVKPDLVILDITMPVMDGFTAARSFAKLFPGVAILLLSMHESPNLINIAKSSGASGYVAKSEGIAAIVKAVDALAHKRTFFPH